MQDELPLALIEEQAEGEVAAEESHDDGDDDGLHEPEGTYDFRRSAGWRGVLAWLRSGAGHESGFYIDFSIRAWSGESFGLA